MQVSFLVGELETRVQYRGWEDPLEKEMAIHSSILVWKIPWTEEPDRLLFVGGTKNQTRLSDFTSLHFTSGELRGQMLHGQIK